VSSIIVLGQILFWSEILPPGDESVLVAWSN